MTVSKFAPAPVVAGPEQVVARPRPGRLGLAWLGLLVVAAALAPVLAAALQLDFQAMPLWQLPLPAIAGLAAVWLVTRTGASR